MGTRGVVLLRPHTPPPPRLRACPAPAAHRERTSAARGERSTAALWSPREACRCLITGRGRSEERETDTQAHKEGRTGTTAGQDAPGHRQSVMGRSQDTHSLPAPLSAAARARPTARAVVSQARRRVCSASRHCRAEAATALRSCHRVNRADACRARRIRASRRSRQRRRRVRKRARLRAASVGATAVPRGWPCDSI